MQEEAVGLFPKLDVATVGLGRSKEEEEDARAAAEEEEAEEQAEEAREGTGWLTIT